MGKKEAYLEKREAQLRELDAEIEQLRATADKAKADAKIKYYEALEGLQTKRQTAAQRLRELRAASGETGLQMMEKEDVDLMLLDVRLPGVSGFEVLRIIKENYPFVEAIVISAVKEVEAAVEAMSLPGGFRVELVAGPLDWSLMPFDSADVATRSQPRSGSSTSARPVKIVYATSRLADRIGEILANAEEAPRAIFGLLNSHKIDTAHINLLSELESRLGNFPEMLVAANEQGPVLVGRHRGGWRRQELVQRWSQPAQRITDRGQLRRITGDRQDHCGARAGSTGAACAEHEHQHEHQHGPDCDHDH